MALLLQHVSCPACGHQHNFGYDGERLEDGCDYTFTCPVTGQAATLRPTGSAEGATHWPQGAVRLEPPVALTRS
jgi:hypothetical protein